MKIFDNVFYESLDELHQYGTVYQERKTNSFALYAIELMLKIQVFSNNECKVAVRVHAF